MKKVLLTKTQRIQRVSNGSDVILKATAPVRVVTDPVPLNSNAYIQRKSFQSVYGDIFRLLMLIPDKGMQQRVIDAINGRGDSDKTSATTPTSHLNKQCCCAAIKVDAFTQTDDEPRILSPSTPNRNHTTPNLVEKLLIKNDSPDSDVPSGSSPVPIPSPAQSKTQIVGKKRGRKRNNCVPKVVKVSAAEMNQKDRDDKQLTPVAAKKKKLEVPGSPEVKPAILERRDSNMTDVSTISINVDECIDGINRFIDGTESDNIYKIMLKEFKTACIKSPQGLLPIHDAILKGDIMAVKRQIFVYTHSNININEMLSDEGEDCLELALMNDTYPGMVTTLLTAGCLPNHIYEKSNTALHIAVINNVERESIRELMLSIDLNLLLQTNDDGYTALHLAVRHNQYDIAEIILDCIDERELNGRQPVYRRSTETPDPRLTPEKAFAKYYERACDRLESTKHMLKDRRLKLEILNAAESRAGNTPLFFAVEQEQEHFCYFLLAHMCDPDQENFNGHSPKSFHYEYARILRINLKISRVMDKVILILNG